MRDKWVVLFAALLGALGGLAVTAVRVDACSCVQDSWQVTRAHVSASDGSNTEERHWPAKGRLTAIPGLVSIWMDDTSSPDTVHLVEASK
jgi:hypothetical protein